MKEYPQRYIEMYGRSVLVQVLNWSEGPPPKYIACNAIGEHSHYGQFLAKQAMGAWMKVDIHDLAKAANLASQIPDDLFTHRDSWRSALEKCRDNCPEFDEATGQEFGDRSYWQHELRVFDRVYDDPVMQDVKLQILKNR